MSDMTVSNLNVDLIQDQAMISLQRQAPISSTGKFGFVHINVNVPLATPGDQPESAMRRNAIDRAKSALREAIAVLDAYPA